jgi:hypothetical protein
MREEAARVVLLRTSWCTDRVRRWVLFLSMAILVGCGTALSPQIAPTDAISHAPLSGWKKIVASDDDHLWMTNFDQLATYDRTTRRWTSQDLPGARNTVDQVVGQPVDGALAVLVSTCSGPCARMRENLDGIRALRSTATGLQETTLPDAPTSFGGIYAVGATGDQARFRIAAGGTWLVDVGPEGSTATHSGASTYLLCPTPTGFAAVESANVDAPAAVRPSNLPPVGGTELDALRVAAGPDPASLHPVQPAPGAAEAMADRLHLGMACLPHGLALLGPTEAWELTNGSWVHAEATLSGSLFDVIEPNLVALPDGSLVGAAVERSTTGTWRRHDASEQVAVMGKTVIRYRPNP